MNREYIIIRGAKEHNLKSINLDIPRNKLIVITGLSGSGKSSLAFDTIYAEGQRRYIESLSSYARQFLEQLQKPDVEYIEGLSPTISIEQRSAGANPRSTVGTQTEIYDYLRLLFARIGTPHCYKCGRTITRQTSGEIVEKIFSLPLDSRIEILAPLVRGRKGEYRQIFKQIKKDGFVRVRVDGENYDIDAEIGLDRKRTHTIEVVVDRLVVNPTIKKRLADSIETALKVGKGIVICCAGKSELLFSELHNCVKCGIGYAEIEPRLFSFNSPYGACPACNGLGTKMEIDPDLVVPDKEKSIEEGAIESWRKGGRGYILYYKGLLRKLADQYGFALNTPFKNLRKDIQKVILYGSEDWIWGRRFEGVVPHLERLFRQTESDYLKSEIGNRYMSVLPCPACKGSRLRPESLSVTIQLARDNKFCQENKISNGAQDNFNSRDDLTKAHRKMRKSIWDVSRMSIKEARDFFDNLNLSSRDSLIAHQILKEIKEKLDFCINVGLDYLTLDRKSITLSGGEAQRMRLATQVGCGLAGVIYVLDEPSIGLHQRDNKKLLATLKILKNLGNTLIVVEHDESTIREAEYIIDLGPAAGRHGGKVVYNGSLDGLLNDPNSLTARYLRGEFKISIPMDRRHPQSKFLLIKGAREHNLKNIDIQIPLGLFVCVTGVSGSGKSTLIDEILYKALAQKLYKSKEKPGEHDCIIGTDFIDKVIVVDQSPIGRTPRSNPATYTGVFTYIRELFSKLPQSRLRGYKQGRFSFNVKGGRCEACAGDGIKKIEMHFLPDVYITCEVCKGSRFNEQTQEILFKGKSIAGVLEMSVEEAMELFKDVPKIKTVLQTLDNVGLGYLQLGQSATTLSGGEAQRVKLASELCKRSTGKTLYILDEPTTGLHFADVDKLLSVLEKLVESGNTVLVIEHNLDVIKTADYIIDLGPEGGDRGGQIVASGSPEQVAKIEDSYTGVYLRKVLEEQG